MDWPTDSSWVRVAKKYKGNPFIWVESAAMRRRVLVSRTWSAEGPSAGLLAVIAHQEQEGGREEGQTAQTERVSKQGQIWGGHRCGRLDCTALCSCAAHRLIVQKKLAICGLAAIQYIGLSSG
jgi:hypothetical protein